MADVPEVSVKFKMSGVPALQGKMSNKELLFANSATLSARLTASGASRAAADKHRRLSAKPSSFRHARAHGWRERRRRSVLSSSVSPAIPQNVSSGRVEMSRRGRFFFGRMRRASVGQRAPRRGGGGGGLSSCNYRLCDLQSVKGK